MTRDLKKLSRLLRAQDLKRNLAKAKLGILSNREVALNAEIEDCKSAIASGYFSQPALSKSLAKRLTANNDQLVKLRRVIERQKQSQQQEETRVDKIETWISETQVEIEEQDLLESIENSVANQIHTSRQ